MVLKVSLLLNTSLKKTVETLLLKKNSTSKLSNSTRIQNASFFLTAASSKMKLKQKKLKLKKQLNVLLKKLKKQLLLLLSKKPLLVTSKNLLLLRKNSLENNQLDYNHSKSDVPQWNIAFFALYKDIGSLNFIYMKYLWII